MKLKMKYWVYAVIFGAMGLAASLATSARAADDQPLSAGLVPPASAAYDAFQPPWLSGRLGLKPEPSSRSAAEIASGLRYYSDTRSLLVPMDQEDSWRLGFGLNIGGTPKVEGVQSGGLGLQPKGSAAGIIFEKKF